MKLYVIEDYRSRAVFYPAGQEIDVSEGDAAFLMADAPGCFSTEKPKPEKKEVEQPQADKMVRRGKTK